MNVEGELFTFLHDPRFILSLQIHLMQMFVSHLTDHSKGKCTCTCTNRHIGPPNMHTSPNGTMSPSGDTLLQAACGVSTPNSKQKHVPLPKQTQNAQKHN